MYVRVEKHIYALRYVTLIVCCITVNSYNRVFLLLVYYLYDYYVFVHLSETIKHREKCYTNNIQTLAHDCKIDTEIVVKRLLILPETWCHTYSPHPHERYYELPLFVLIGG